MIARVLGFDFGHKKIGIAFGQSFTCTAHPVHTLHYQAHQPLWDKIYPFIETWQPSHLLVGIPLNMDDSPSALSTAARNFARYLQKKSRLPIITVDERLSTRAAGWACQTDTRQTRSTRKKNLRAPHNSLDAIAATILVESWLKDPSLSNLV